ncbi:MAG: tRNA epoxyqueuosine(34) reductase QueG [Proteobacteria bacterium]|nr:tRNA epoxyqueuosine(34) reductase QueG [Pseudomonadota bacterium]MCP4917012.1 tRNA epoxyqueuosine(34) reductase QueG [Pseudomonadota bacterium]
MNNLSELLQREAAALGLQHVRAVSVEERAPRIEAFDAWLESGHHGQMRYLARGRDDRADPRRRLPARTAVVFALEHHHELPPDPGGLTGRVARYAWGRDYHNVLGKRLRKLRRNLRHKGIDSWGGVDTAPILERAWSESAGLGFSGKNCVQILPARGSWMLLGVVFLPVALEVEGSGPLREHCGACRRCLDACPTEAFVDARELDSTRCISYWTIETRGSIPVELRAGFGRWVFGCDVCQEVCPHNAAPPPGDEALAPRHAWLDLAELIDLDDGPLMERFNGSPIKRPGPDGLRRNACVVLGNLGSSEAIPVLERALKRGPLVEEHARWALDRLG